MSRGRFALVTHGLPRQGPVGRWLLGQVGLAGTLGLWAAISLVLVLATARLSVPVGQIWPVLTALLLLKWLLAAVGDPPRPPPAPPEAVGGELVAAGFPHRDRWERRLSISDRDPSWYRRVVRDRVTAVAAERLRQRHGISLRDQPGAARQVLGEPLYEFLTGPVTRTPGPAELDRLLSRMEEI